DRYDYIIVGNGLAGSTLALHLHNAGKRLIVFTGKEKNPSSLIAAGLYNPITGRKMVKTWRADDLFSYLETYYEEAEKLTGGTFLIKKTIYRPFFEAEEQNEWMGKSADQNYTTFIKKVHTSSTHSAVHDAFGGLALATTGYLDIPKCMESVTDFLRKKHTVIDENFDYQELIPNSSKVTYQGVEATKAIFCDGVGLKANTFFSWLPIRPVKGEILYIKTSVKLDYILNRGVFVLPIGNDIYKVGSTYDHNDSTLEPTSKAREQLISKLKAILDGDFEIVDQVAGLRPATKDRRPFVGMHPEFETIGVFNGLGTKGVSLAPYWARHFVQHLLEGNKLDREVNISRYFSLYSESH
ncbi:FAD-binding oxidoreductase, partial [Fulvivirga sp. RKSG066]|uniref:NAD(P)/FAD-dependent oxidoreductase n=1 Tax=Fulvivirga aurantia TaxID=2529383 RepID=UPI0012BCBDCC